MPLTSAHIEDIFSSPKEHVQNLLSGILNLNLQHESNEKVIISIINKLLSTAKHRREGLEYLSLIINNCSSSTILDNALKWTEHCVIKYAGDVLREQKLTVLAKIIDTAHKQSDFNKKFVSDFISKVLDNCITTSHVNSYECKAALVALSTSMKCYPGWFGAHTQKVQNYLLIFLDSNNEVLVQNAAVAFHYLQQVGSAGANGTNHKTNFTQIFHKLCRTVHNLFDTFFDTEKEIFSTEHSDDEVFEFNDDASSNSQAVLHVNAKRINNCLKFIETFIKTKFPVAKETKPKELLDLITRGTAIHRCITGESFETLESYQFSLLLSQIQATLLRLLRLSIIWYKTNILPFSYTISKVLVDIIERSQNCECFKCDRLYQESAYRALNKWLSLSKSSFHSHFQDQILTCILKDVTPVKTQISLTISEAASGKKSLKAKRKAIANRIIASSQILINETSTKFERSNEIITCIFALDALRRLLESTRLNIKPTLLKDLYKSVFDSLTSIQSSKPLQPYTDPKCQSGLYQVMVAFYHQNTLGVLPPLHTSLDILARGANGNNIFVSDICERGLRTLEVLCQPVCPSLYLGVVQSEDADEVVGVRKDIMIKEDIIEKGVVDDVDYDASTDEFIPNKNDQATTSGQVYNVNDSDNDHSTIEGLSEKDTNDEGVEIEELSSEPDNSAQNDQMDDSDHPVVTGPSEDGNEILENGEDEPKGLDTIYEEQEKVENEEPTDSKDKNKKLREEKQEATSSNNKEYLDGGAFDVGACHDVIDRPQESETQDNQSEEVSEEQGEALKEAEFNAQEEEISTSSKIDLIEPPAKKAKPNQPEDDDIEVVFEESAKMEDANAKPNQPEVDDIEVVFEESAKMEDANAKPNQPEDDDIEVVFEESAKMEDADANTSLFDEDSFVDEVRDY